MNATSPSVRYTYYDSASPFVRILTKVEKIIITTGYI